MRIDFNFLNKVAFTGKREDKNKVRQLSTDNDFALTENNQRGIKEAITNLSKDSDEKNIKFLMSVAENLKYGFNLDLNKQSNNNWKVLLKNAAKEAIDKTSEDKKPSLESEFRRVFLEKKDLKPEEKEILGLREEILTSNVVKNALMSVGEDNIDTKNRANIANNLDNFVISSEVSLKEKKACLEKIKFFLSPEYKIDPQLKNKKADVLSEVLNDIVIKTPDSPVLLIKQSNQQESGECAAISKCRKALAYEDKSKYLEVIFSEVDDKDTMDVYDITKIGQGVKVPMPKADIDFDYAAKKGYRIIDASALNWMNIAGVTGGEGRVAFNYVAFDNSNFDTFHDSFFTKDLDDEELASQHDYLRTMSKAKENVVSVKSSLIKMNTLSEQQRLKRGGNMQLLGKVNQYLENDLAQLMPSKSKTEVRYVMNGLLNLEVPKSDKVKSEFNFIPNEEECMKKAKIEKYLVSKDPSIDREKLDSKLDEIYELRNAATGVTSMITKKYHPNTVKDVSRLYKKIFSAGASYATAMNVRLNSNQELGRMLVKYNVVDFETRLSKNLDKLSNAVQNPAEEKMTGLLQKKLGLKNKTEVVEFLSEAKKQVEQIKTTEYDKLNKKMLLGSRKEALIPFITDAEEKIKKGDKEQLEISAENLAVAPDKAVVLKQLSEMKKTLQENPSEEKYIESLNKMGFKHQSALIAKSFNNLKEVLFSSAADSDVVVAFAKENNVEPTIDAVDGALEKLANEINASANKLAMIEESVELTDEKGKLVNTVDSKEVMLKLLEQKGEIVSESKLRPLHEKFLNIREFEQAQENSKRQGSEIKNPDIYKFSDEEKETIKKIEGSLNSMYKESVREVDRMNKVLDKPLSKLFSEVGQESGSFWEGAEGHSGLNSRQQIRIYEQMTDRRYYVQENLLKAAEQIKEGAHSGVSATSVSHKEMAGHAQYVADIKPVTMIDPSTGKEVVKDAVMHDNTWGPSEHANTWVDSKGLRRTDYGSEYGGQRGYITDETSKNGTLIEDYLSMTSEPDTEKVNNKVYNKLHKEQPELKFSLFRDIILDGKEPKLKQSTAQMVMTVFFMNAIFAQDFKKMVDNAAVMTDEEIDSACKNVEKNIQSTPDKEEAEILEAINGNEFEKGISTPEQYNKLDKNHPMKVCFKKMAIKESCASYTLEDEVDKCSTAAQLSEVEQNVNSFAKDEYRFMFGKTKDSVLMFGDMAHEDILNAAKTLLKKNGISLEHKRLTDANVENSVKDAAEKTDGRMSKTAEMIASNIADVISEKVEDRDKFAQARDGFVKDLSAVIKEKSEFKISEMNTNSNNFKNAKKWIDKKYNPDTDEEFVAIYNDLQEKSTEEFNELLDEMSVEDLGVKKVDEFSYINGIRGYNTDVLERLSGEIGNLHDLKTPGALTPDEAKTPKQKFEDAYQGLYAACSDLNLDEIIKPNKEKMFNDYGVRPAFPNVQIISDTALNDLVEGFAQQAGETVSIVNSLKRQQELYIQGDKIAQIMENTPADKTLTAEEKEEIFQVLGEVAMMHQDDPGLKGAVEAAIEGVGMKNATKIGEFVPVMQSILGDVNSYKLALPEDKLQEAMVNLTNQVQDTKKLFVKANIQPRYQANVASTLDKYLASLKNGKSASAETLSKLKDDVKQFHITKKSSELVKGMVQLLKKNDSKDENLLKIYDNYLGEVIAANSVNKLAFLLISSTADGYSHEMKAELKNFTVPKPHKKAGVKLDSKEGVKVLIQEIRANSNNLDTLHLFLNQLGFNEDALNIEIEDTKLAKLKKISDDKYNSLLDAEEANGIVSSELLKVLPKLTNPSSNLPSVVTKLNNDIEKKAQEAGLKDFAVIEIFKQTFSEFVEYMKAQPEVDRSAVLSELINQKGRDQADEYSQMLQDDLCGICDALTAKIDYVSKLELKEGSQAAKDREQFIEKLTDAIDYNSELIENLLG